MDDAGDQINDQARARRQAHDRHQGHESRYRQVTALLVAELAIGREDRLQIDTTPT